MQQQQSHKSFIMLICLFLLIGLGCQRLKSATTPADQTQKQQQVTKKQNSKNQTWQKEDQPVRIPILMYHAIHQMAPEESASANLIVDPELFEAQIKALVTEGYYFLTPEEAHKALTSNSLPSKKVVWLTFDDGNADFYSHAYPILKKYKAKATNNIITGFVENNYPGNLTIQQMLEMGKNGMSFQGHTITHPDLSATDPNNQLLEVSASKDFLDQQLKQQTMTIAYPSGRYNQETLDLSEKAGYKLGLTTNEGLASAADGLLSLNRVRILPTTTPEQLLQQISTK